MLKTIESVIAGYLAMAAVVMIGTVAAAATMIPGGLAGAKALDRPPPRNYLLANLVVSFVAALVGGWVTTRMAASRPGLHAIALAVLVVLMSVVSARSQAKQQPKWYPWTIAVVGVAGILLSLIFTARPAG